jgi:hypothetical protein
MLKAMTGTSFVAYAGGMRLLAALAATALLAGCGSDGGTESEQVEPADAGSDLPDCSTVWQVGETLPDPYEGCSDNGSKVAPVFHSCTATGGEGRYVEWGDGAAYAREGGKIIDTLGELARICD